MTDIRYDAAALTNRTAHSLFGIVSAVDPANHAVKVRIQPDNVETGWIPDVGGVQAGDLRISRPSSPGTHVVLQPVEGDGEHFVVIGVVFDTVVTPPVSPATEMVAQSGEMLVMAGCGSPPTQGREIGPVAAGGGWLHLTGQGFFAGAGKARLNVQNASVQLSVDGMTCTLSASGLVVSGGDVRTDSHSLNNHIHPLGSQMTGRPLG